MKGEEAGKQVDWLPLLPRPRVPSLPASLTTLTRPSHASGLHLHHHILSRHQSLSFPIVAVVGLLISEHDQLRIPLGARSANPAGRMNRYPPQGRRGPGQSHPPSHAHPHVTFTSSPSFPPQRHIEANCPPPPCPPPRARKPPATSAKSPSPS